ncbi:carbohydrate ABC transporter permease [Gottfriedia acidiceleris]|uniref:carbohydrate ABC transporter permease n=1 Tax=Gottfriedia acidiceleris TaxID=371036 RepID=UPI003394F27D
MENERYTGLTFLLELFGIILAIFFLVPFYYVLGNSFKSFADILQNTSSLPKSLDFTNYSQAIAVMDFWRALLNSLIVTVASNVLIVLFCSMAAYKLVRTRHKISTVIFFIFVATMVIPFQSIMIPLVKVGSTLHLMNSHYGLVVMYLAFGSALSIFLYHGFIKGIPIELEEAAIIDGCSPWIWNDFLLPSLVLRDEELRTIPLATFYFFGAYTKQWNLALAGLVLGITPLLIFFFAAQKQIIRGITSGSIK